MSLSYAPAPPQVHAGGCGLAWRVVPSLNHGTIDNHLYVAAAIAADDVWVAGTDRIGNASRTLLFRWNGSQWTEVTGPNPSFDENYLFSLQAVASNDVWAMSHFGNRTSSLLILARRYFAIRNS